MTSKKTKVNKQLDNKSELEIVLDRLHAEVDFAAKNFNSNSGHFANDLDCAMREMRESLLTYKEMLNRQDTQIKDLHKQLSTLALVPDKVQQRVSLLIPQIVKKVEKVQVQFLEEFQHQQEESLKNLMTSYIPKLNESIKSVPLANIENTQVSKERNVERQGSTSMGWSHTIAVRLACFGAGVGSSYVLLWLF